MKTLKILFVSLALIFTSVKAEIPKVGKFLKIPMSEYKLVYTTTYGSLYDDFSKEIEEITAEIKQYSLNPLKIVVIYLDSDTPNNVTTLDARKNKEQSAIEAEIQNNVAITKDLLEEIYPAAYLNYKRRVLIGALLLPSITFNNTNKYKSIDLPANNVMGFQVLLSNLSKDFDQKTFTAYSRSSILRYIYVKRAQDTLFLTELKDTAFGSSIFFAYPFSKELLEERYTEVEETKNIN